MGQTEPHEQALSLTMPCTMPSTMSFALVISPWKAPYCHNSGMLPSRLRGGRPHFQWDGPHRFWPHAEVYHRVRQLWPLLTALGCPPLEKTAIRPLVPVLDAIC